MPSARSTDRARRPATVGPTISARFAAKLLAFAAGDGLDAMGLRAAAGLRDASLDDPEGRVPLADVYTLVEAIAARCEQAASVRFAARLEASDFDALGFLLLTSPTIGASIERFVALQRLYADGERYELVPCAGGTTIRFTPWGPPRPAHAWMADVAFGDILGSGQALLGQPLPLGPVRLRRTPPADPRPWLAALGPVEFGALVDEVTLPAEALALALPEANQPMHAFFERLAREQLARLPRDMSLGSRVRALIAGRLHTRAPDLASAAEALRMSPRTLQRRLHDEGGETLNGLVEAVRRERAAALLATSLPLSEVSQLLGYADPSVFFRAFRRWTGETPLQYRARALSRDAG